MPRFTLHQPEQAAGEGGDVPAGLRADGRVKIIDEVARLLLIDCPREVAEEWLGRMPGWKLQEERRAKVPDARPKLK